MGLQETLQQQYNKTLQGTIGQSQRARQQAQRASQGQVGSSDPSTDWAARQASGFRGAGFNDVTQNQANSLDASTQGFLKPYLNSYTEGGQNQSGYYGDKNPYTESGGMKLAQEGGYNLADNSLQEKYKSVGMTLPSIFGKSLANQYNQDVGGQIDMYHQQQAAQQQATQKQQDLSYLWNMYNPNLKAGQMISRNVTSEVSGADQIAQAQKYAKMGFVPGQNVGDYKWQPFVGKSALTYGPNSGNWTTSDGKGLMWNQNQGYVATQPMDEAAAMRNSIGLVGSVIGGVVLPGLSATGALGGAGAAGLGATPTELAIDAGALGGANTGAFGAASMGSAGLLGQGGIFGTGVDLGSGLANTFAEGLSKNMALSGGDIKQSSLSSLLSAGAGFAGSTVGNNVSSYLKDLTGNANISIPLGSITGGVTRQGLSNLLSKNKFGDNTGMAALQGGLSSLGNLFAPKGSSPQQIQQLNQIGKQAGSLAKMFTPAKKLKVK